jgi:hypothetical protein
MIQLSPPLKAARAMSDYDRLLETAMREFERKVVSLVEQKFELVAKRMQSGEECEIPIIGGKFPPPEYRIDQKQRVMRALRAQKWFEYEAPLWAQPLPLRLEDCFALFNQPNRRLCPVGKYGILLREMDWNYRLAKPFEVFTAYELSPPP